MQSEKGDTPAKMGSYCGINNKTRDYLPKRMYVFAGVRVNCICHGSVFYFYNAFFVHLPSKATNSTYIFTKKKRNTSELTHSSIPLFIVTPIFPF